MKHAWLWLTVLLGLVGGRARAFECADRHPITVYFVIDASGSMSGARQVAASGFAVDVLAALRATGHYASGGAGYFDTIYAEFAITTNATALDTNLRNFAGVTLTGGTALYDALVVGSTRIAAQPAGNARLMVVLSDGEDTDSASTFAQARASLNALGSVAVELIAIDGVSMAALTPFGGGNIRVQTASASALRSLVTSVVDRTCSNWRPDAAMTRTPNGNLDLGRPGFTMTFDGSPSADRETPDSGLTFSWAVTGPGSRGFSQSGMTITHTFTDADIGTGWSAALTVRDPQGATHSVTQTFAITGSPPNLSIAAPSPIDALQTLSATATPTTDIDGGPPLVFRWELLQAPARASRQPPLVSMPPGPPFDTNAISWLTDENDITLVGTTSTGRWRFRVTATDNENDTDSEIVEIDVRNLKVGVDLHGDAIVPVGDDIALENRDGVDPDGGTVTFRWEVEQYPNSAAITTPFGTTQNLTRSTSANMAGMWRFAHTATDNEGEEVKRTIEVLVDALPTATITAPDHSAVEVALTLDGSSSRDPDSPVCPSDPHDCHTVITGAYHGSPGIIRHVWTLVDARPDQEGAVIPGSVEDVLDQANGPTVTIPAARLPPGMYTFQLEVEDGEHHTATATKLVQITPLDTLPFPNPRGPMGVVTDVNRIPATDVILDGSGSFDLDNLVRSQPWPGITNYAWDVVSRPPGCVWPSTFVGPIAVLFPAGAPIPIECFGWWTVRLTVTDDDPPGRVNSAATWVLLRNCDQLLCIDAPKTNPGVFIEFSDQARVIIAYHFDAALRSSVTCASGCYTKLTLFHESAPSTPVFTDTDANPFPTGIGGQTFFSWNGKVRDPATGLLRTPREGRYSTRVELVDYAFAGSTISATETNNIRIAVADAAIAPSTDQYLSYNAAEAGTDSAHIRYETTGGATVLGTSLLIYRRGDTTPLHELPGFLPPTGTAGEIDWNGMGPSTRVPAGLYDVAVKLLGAAGAVLGVSDKSPLTIYQIDLSLNGLAAADEDTPGAFLGVSTTDRIGHVTLTPAALPGTVTIAHDGPTGTDNPLDGTAPPGDWAAGVTMPAGSASPSAEIHFKVKKTAPAAVHLRASYTPPGAAAAKEAKDLVTITPVEADAIVPCSNADREESDGIFLQRRKAIGPVDPIAEQPMMRVVKVKASHVLDEVHIRILEGAAPSTKAVLVGRATSGAAQTVLGNDVAVDPSLHTAMHLDEDYLVRGLADAGEATLVVEIKKGGTVVAEDKVKLRLGDLAPLVGDALAAQPYFRTRRALASGAALTVALDPAYHDERRTFPAKLFVVEHKTPAEWLANPALADVTGGEDAVSVPAAPGQITTSTWSAWATALSPALTRPLDVVIDFGKCASAPVFGTLDPEDIIMPIELNQPTVTVIGDLSTPGPLATASFEIGDDFEPGAGASCTPREERSGPACVPGAGARCSTDGVCVDTNGDGAFHCSRIHTESASGAVCPPTLCAVGQACLDNDKDGIAHCTTLSTDENLAGVVCPATACAITEVCADSNGDGIRHCTQVQPACAAGQWCVNTNNDEVATCRPIPMRVPVPAGWDDIGQPTRENCTNGADDDGNGDIDCADAQSCIFHATCRGAGKQGDDNCGNGIDEDGNGFTDCDDQACYMDCGGRKLRLRAKIVHPTPLPASAPIVVMAHGNHLPFRWVWRRTERFRNVLAATSDENYRGHTWLQELLASRGFITVSVDLDQMSGVGPAYPTVPRGNKLRAWVALKTLDALIVDPRLAGHVDLSRITFLGHSRGGETALLAWQIMQNVGANGPQSGGLPAGPDASITNFTAAGIESVVSLAPTTFYGLAPPIGTTPFYLLYGTADGDVNGASQGVRPLEYFDHQGGPRFAAFLRGGNHNNWNENWVPDDANPLSVGLVGKPEQQQFAKLYVMAALLSPTMPILRELFEQSPQNLVLPGLGALQVTTQSRRGVPTFVIDDYQTQPSAALASSGAAVTWTGTAPVEAQLSDPSQGVPGDVADFFFQDTRGGFATWTAASMLRWTLTAATDVSARAELVVRLAQQPEHANTVALGGPLAFTITLFDDAGASFAIPSSYATTLSVPYSSTVNGRNATSAKMETLRIPLDRFRVGATALDLTKLKAVVFDFGAISAQGRIAIDDLEIE